MDYSQIVDLPEFGSAVAAVASLAVAVGGWLFGRVTGQKAPVVLMQILHSAVESVAKAAIKRNLSAAEAAELLFEHLFASVPDTVRKLQPSGEVLGTLLEGKLGDAAALQHVADAPALRENVAEHVLSMAQALGKGGRVR